MNVDINTKENILDVGIEKAGPQGLSAYQVAQKNGYIGTEQEWLASLKGDIGDTGPQGETGPAGRDGYKQYTAGDNITIKNDVISANVPTIDLSDYYTKEETNIKLQDILPTYIITNNSYSNPFVVEGCPKGIYLSEGKSIIYMKGFNTTSTSNQVEINGGFLVITNSDITEENPGYQEVGYIIGTYKPEIGGSNGYHIANATLSVRGSTGKVQRGSTSGVYVVSSTEQQNISGIKTFLSLPETSLTPTKTTQFVNKEYVDNAIASAITNALGGEY